MTTFRTIITKDDMARIFELRAAHVPLTNIAKDVGYDYTTVKRGIVIAELFGVEACR